MKLLKSTLFMIALLIMQPASARPQTTSKRTTSTAKKVPARTTQRRGRTTQTKPPASTTAPVTFQGLLQKIRTTMRSADVINSEGVFTDTFENMVRASGLDPMAMEALMQAGRNLHLPLLGSDEENLELAMYTDERISNFMERNKDAEFYDYWTTELKQDYLDKKVQELIGQGKTASAIISLLQRELGQKMQVVWVSNNVENIRSRTEDLNKQIADTVQNLHPRIDFAAPKLEVITEEETVTNQPVIKLAPPKLKVITEEETITNQPAPAIIPPAPGPMVKKAAVKPLVLPKAEEVGPVESYWNMDSMSIKRPDMEKFISDRLSLKESDAVIVEKIIDKVIRSNGALRLLTQNLITEDNLRAKINDQILAVLPLVKQKAKSAGAGANLLEEMKKKFKPIQ